MISQKEEELGKLFVGGKYLLINVIQKREI